MAEAPASDMTRTAGETRGQTRRRWTLFLGLAGVVVLLDQASKTWVDTTFDIASRSVPSGEPGGPTEVLGEWLRISKTYNDGAVFGLLDTAAPMLAVVTLFVVVGIIWYEWRYAAALGPLVTIGLGLLLGGAIGNVIDRFRFGHVIDFVDMGIGSTRWFAFNVSDAAVSMGILALLVAALLGERAPGVRGPDRPVAETDSATPPTGQV